MSQDFAVKNKFRGVFTLFKIYINAALSGWKRHSRGTGILINDDCLYMFLIEDDQIVVALDEKYSNYTIRKLHEEKNLGASM